MKLEPVHILLVDDRPENLLALESLLRQDGVEFHRAGSGEEALSLLLEQDFALALLDVQMPGMTGFELAELMRGTARTQGIPIIFVTAAREDVARTFAGYEAGAVDFLYKPLDPTIVRSKVRVFVELDRQKRMLSNTHRWLEGVLDRLPVPVCFLEPGTARVTFANAAAHRLAGGAFPAQLAAPHPDVELTWPDGRPVTLDDQPATRAARGEYVQDEELVLRTPAGRFTVLVNCAPVGAGHGRPPTVLTSLQDISRVKQAEAGLAAALKARDTFIGVASHELRNPLSAMRTTLSLLRRDTAKLAATGEPAIVERVNRSIATVDRQATRMSRLVDDLLHLSQELNGRFTLEVREVDLATIVRETAAEFEEAFRRAACELELQVPPTLPGRWDAERVSQLVSNLLSNASKYAPGCPVRLEVAEEPDAVRISVSDRGPGIPAEHRARLFERFTRGNGHPGVAGVGLGLYVVREIARAHGGTVDLESESGRGTTFTVRLPRVPRTGAPAPG